MSTHRIEKRLTERYRQQPHDIEYVVRAHPDPTGWIIVVDPVELDIDRDGTVRSASIIDSLAVTTAVPEATWNEHAADRALHAIGFDRAEPWDLRSSTGLTACTQAVTHHRAADARTLRAAS